MKQWNDFLTSLSTRGGAIFLLLFIVAVVDVGAFTMYLRHDISAENLKDIVSSGMFTGALLIALKGSSDSTATATTSPSGSTVTVASDSGKVAVNPPEAGK